MGKLITITEAAAILGVSRQNLTNWGESGILKMRRMGKGNASLWVNADDINALSIPMKEIDRSQKILEVELKEIMEKEREARNTLKDIKRQIRLTRRFANMVITTHFDISFIEAMRVIGKINDRDAEIMKCVVRGDDIDSIAGDFKLSRSRVMQIFFKGCRKCGDTFDIKERFDEARRMKEEMNEMRNAMRLVQDENDQLREKLKMEKMTIDESEQNELEGICALFNKEIIYCDVSVRALNCLKEADIRTIGDLCKWSKSELLRLRNFGRRSLVELDDLLESMGLSWGMDVDSYYKNKILKGAYDTSNDE